MRLGWLLDCSPSALRAADERNNWTRRDAVRVNRKEKKSLTCYSLFFAFRVSQVTPPPAMSSNERSRVDEERREALRAIESIELVRIVRPRTRRRARRKHHSTLDALNPVREATDAGLSSLSR